MSLEEVHGVPSRLQATRGLRLEGQADGFARALSQPVQVCSVCENSRRRDFLGARLSYSGCEPERYRAHAAVDAVRQELCEEVCQQVRVAEASGLGPIGSVDGFLHPSIVKVAVGEPVDREHVEIVLGEQPAKVVEGRGLRQTLGRARRKAEADSERRRRRDASLYGHHVPLDDGTDLGPSLAGVDVGAVG
jgi:hypothetical protein